MSTTTKNNIVFISTQKENFYCSICNYPLLSNEDFNTRDQYCACHDCFLTFIENESSVSLCKLLTRILPPRFE